MRRRQDPYPERQSLAQHMDGQLTESNKELQQALTDLDQTLRLDQTTLPSVKPNTPSRANIDQSLHDLA